MKFKMWVFMLLSFWAASVFSAETVDTGSLQPGDVVYIGFPGEAEFNQNFTLDAEGKIDLPELGPFTIGGLHLEDATGKLKELLGLLYLNSSTLTLELRERNRMIQVRGYVNMPGTVTLNARGNIQTAIQQAGGLLQGAQLDRFQLQRDGQTTVFSYKAYLDSGDESQLPALQSMDVVFVPASPLTGNVQIDFDAATLASNGDAGDRENSYRIFGEVKSAGRYALKDNLTLIDAIMRAGGVTRYAGVEQIKVIANGEPTRFNLKQYLETGDATLMPALTPNITIFVPIQEEAIKTGNSVVYIMGEVFKPGAFESKAEAGLLDILANAGGPTRFAESRQIRILRADGSVTPFDLQQYTEGEYRDALPMVNPGDAIFVPEKTDTDDASWLKVPTSRAIRIIGQVYNPGRFEWSDEMSLMDILAHAEGPTARADIARIRILTEGADDQINSVEFDLDAFIRDGGDRAIIPTLTAGSTVVVPELPQEPNDDKAQWLRQDKDDSIYILGQVGSPGRYRFNNDLTFLDILSAADGPTGQADLHHIKIVHRNDTRARMTELNLAQYFQTGDESLLPIVRPGDSIFIPEKSANWLDTPKNTVVKVIGAVNKPGRYAFNDDMTLLDLLTQAGGMTPSALTKKIVVLNSSDFETRSVTFNLMKFLKSPDMSDLPIIRAGDTLFVPDRSDSQWTSFMDGIKDSLSILSLVALLGVL